MPGATGRQVPEVTPGGHSARHHRAPVPAVGPAAPVI